MSFPADERLQRNIDRMLQLARYREIVRRQQEAQRQRRYRGTEKRKRISGGSKKKNPWLVFVNKIWKQNPKLSYKQAMKVASPLWKKKHK